MSQRPKTIQLLGKKHRGKLYDIGIGSNFLDMTLKAETKR